MPDLETSAELRAAITDAEAAADRTADRLEALTAERRRALLADERDLVRVEEEMARGQRDRERAVARVEVLRDRLRAAEAAEQRARRQEDREQTAAAIREKLAVDRKLDQALAVVADLAAKRRELDATIRRRWLMHQDDLGPYSAEFLHDHYAIRAAVPPALALELGVPAGLGKPLAQGDVALHALARLEGEAQPQPAPVRAAEPAGPRVIVGEVPPPRPEAPDDLGRLRRLFSPPTPRDPLAPPPRRL